MLISIKNRVEEHAIHRYFAATEYLMPIRNGTVETPLRQRTARAART
jgi:hypothetical protein